MGCADNNGSIEIIAGGGLDLEYSIDNGIIWQANNIFTNLSTDIYVILVRTSDEVCQTAYDDPIFLVGDLGLTITNVSSTNPTDCGGTNGSITVTASGANNLEYSIDNGAIWQADSVFNNLSAGHVFNFS